MNDIILIRFRQLNYHTKFKLNTIQTQHNAKKVDNKINSIITCIQQFYNL